MSRTLSSIVAGLGTFLLSSLCGATATPTPRLAIPSSGADCVAQASVCLAESGQWPDRFPGSRGRPPAVKGLRGIGPWLRSSGAWSQVLPSAIVGFLVIASAARTKAPTGKPVSDGLPILPMSPVRTRDGPVLELMRHFQGVDEVDKDEVVQHHFELLEPAAQLARARLELGGQPLLAPGQERVDQAPVPVARLARGRPTAGHLLLQCEVLAEEVANARGHGDLSGRSFRLELLVNHWIDAAMNEPSKPHVSSVHRAKSVLRQLSCGSAWLRSW